MEYYKYVSQGLSLSGKAGKVSYLHCNCYQAMVTTTAGPEGKKTAGSPPAGAKCVWCGKGFER